MRNVPGKFDCPARCLSFMWGELAPKLALLPGCHSLNTVMIYTEPTLADLAGRMENVRQ
jgi:hypothetical protein